MAEALQGLEREPFDIVVAALGLPANGCAGLHGAMRRRPEWDKIPLLALADRADQIPTAAGPAIFEDCQPKFDREAMLESLLRLAAATAPACVLGSK
jgi:hypothetical protein